VHTTTTCRYTLVVASALLPQSQADIVKLLEIFEVYDDGYLNALTFPVLDDDNNFLDFCWGLRTKHWELSFERDYMSYAAFPSSASASQTHSDEEGRQAQPNELPSSVRTFSGNFNDQLYRKGATCKVCDVVAPTFLARTKALQLGHPFRSSLDGDWAMLDYFLRARPYSKVEASFLFSLFVQVSLRGD
jgi:hypothetical protein